jgi:hypothetical protein
MLEDMNKLLDVLENMAAKVDANDPKEVNELEAFVGRLEGLAMEIKDRTET